MRGEVRAAAEDRPGVYRMLSTDGEVLYIGKSKRIRTRLMSYFRCAYPEEKGARILREGGEGGARLVCTRALRGHAVAFTGSLSRKDRLLAHAPCKIHPTGNDLSGG